MYSLHTVGTYVHIPVLVYVYTALCLVNIENVLRYIGKYLNTKVQIQSASKMEALQTLGQMLR